METKLDDIQAEQAMALLEKRERFIKLANERIQRMDNALANLVAGFADAAGMPPGAYEFHFRDGDVFLAQKSPKSGDST